MDELSKLVGELNGSDLLGQRRAAEKLAQQAGDAQRALVALVRGSGSSDEEVAAWCGSALEDGGAPAADQIGELTRLAADGDATVAYWAITLLGRARSGAEAAAATLVKRLDEGPPEVQLRAAWALAHIGARGPEVLAALQRTAQRKGPAASAARQALDELAEG